MVFFFFFLSRPTPTFSSIPLPRTCEKKPGKIAGKIAGPTLTRPAAYKSDTDEDSADELLGLSGVNEGLSGVNEGIVGVIKGISGVNEGLSRVIFVFSRKYAL